MSELSPFFTLWAKRGRYGYTRAGVRIGFGIEILFLQSQLLFFCAGLSDIRFGLSNYKAKTFWLAQEMSTILWLVNNAHNVTYKLHRQKRHKYPKMRNSNLSEVSLGISEPFSSSQFRGRKSRQKKPKVEDVEYDDNLTREESEERINLLLLILAILNIISATTMSGYEL